MMKSISRESRLSTAALLSIFILGITVALPAKGNWLSTHKGELATLIQERYFSIDFGTTEKPAFDIFKRGLVGFLNLKSQGKLASSELLTLIDFRLSSNKKRMWIIDLSHNRLVHHSLVAHGKNTGNEFARKFSNIINSNQSSLGFYITGKTYYGKHGLSLRLDGVEQDINHHARERAIVMHGADYVDPGYSSRYGRIGRSFGCPAIPMEDHETIIKLLANQTCLFIYYPNEDYLNHTSLDDENLAYEMIKTGAIGDAVTQHTSMR